MFSSLVGSRRPVKRQSRSEEWINDPKKKNSQESRRKRERRGISKIKDIVECMADIQTQIHKEGNFHMKLHLQRHQSHHSHEDSKERATQDTLTLSRGTALAGGAGALAEASASG